MEKKATVVIFAKSQTDEQKKMLENLLNAIDETLYEVIVFEQTVYIAGKGTTIRKKETFNFNKFCNDAMRISKTDLVLIANNDIEPQPGWIEALINEVNRGNLVVSSHDPNDNRQKSFKANQRGHVCGKHFSGWCFMIHKKAWNKIGAFDEDFPFWCADNAFLEQLKEVGITPVLVYNSKVKHLVSKTLSAEAREIQRELTGGQIKKFNRKYNKNLFNIGK